MKPSLYIYIRYIVGSDSRRVITSYDLVISLTVFIVVIMRWICLQPSASVTYDDLSVSIMTYAAVAVGFSIAAMSLVLVIPQRRFSQWLTKSSKDSRKSAFRSLLLVYSWVAVVHWIVIVTFLSLTIVGSNRAVLFPLDEGFGARLLGSFVLGLVSYAVLTLLNAILSLALFADLYIRFLQRDQMKDTKPSDAGGANN